MAATVPIVGNRRENPSVHLRPIAQAGSHRPAMSRKSQAMGDPLYNVCSTQCLSTLSTVRAACPRKKDSAAKNYEFEKKKTAYFARGGGLPRSNLPPAPRLSAYRGRPEVIGAQSERRD